MLHKSQISVIHVARSRCGLSEEDYRALLESVGAKSSLDLDPDGFAAVMKHFETLGFVSNGAARIRAAADSRRPLLSKIGAMLTDQGLSWAYADGIAKRMFKVHRCQWCKPEQLLKIVAALAYKKRKEEARAKAQQAL